MASLTPVDLANMVKNGQFTQLREYGGAEKLAAKLNCFDVSKGLDPNVTDLDEIKRIYGANELEPPYVPAYLKLVWDGLHDLTILLLIAAAIVSLILGIAFEEDKSTAWIEGAAILVAVTVVVNFQAWTDYNNARTFRAQYLELDSAKRVNVIRQGELQTIHPRELVVGDVLRLEAGSVLPADGVLIEGRALKLDESALTGESKLLDKTTWAISTDLTKEQKSSPFMLSGTSVVNGNGRMLVVAVGVNSLQGQILAAVVGQDKSESNKTVPENSRKAMPSITEGGRSNIDTEIQLPSLESNFFAAAEDSYKASSMRVSQFSIKSQRTIAPDGKILAEATVRKGRYNRICCGSDGSNKSLVDGGTLSDKLDTLALRIGKVGVTVGVAVFIVMCARWAVEEFGDQQGVCNYFDTNVTICAKARSNYGCVVDVSNSSCSRAWNGAEDISRILRFFITAITILVVVVPEGLPLAVALSLSLSMRRMARENNQVKNMDSSETMGSATTICTDKTGTLTENRMTVVRVNIADNEFKPLDESIGAQLMASNAVSESITKKLKECCSLATSPSSIVEGRTQRGNATDCALLRLVQDMGHDWKQARAVCKPAQPSLDWGVHAFPFSSSRKRSSIVVALPSGGFRVYSIGAPQYILDTCTNIIDMTGAVASIDNASRESIETVLESYAHQAMRTIGLAYRDLPSPPSGGWDQPSGSHDKASGDGEEDVVLLFAAEEGLTLLGVVGIEDPLRPSVVEAVKKCYTAGVDVRMCTGDALETAVAISLQCGILRQRDMKAGPNGRLYPKECFAMTGAEFDERIHERDHSKPLVWRRAYDFKTKKFGEMRAPPFKVDVNGDKIVNMKRFDEVWPRLRVLARCLPEDKLNLVRGVRRSELFKDKRKCDELEEEFGIKIFPDHQVVAVTGDGTNDAPALKAADVGFAMGIVGTDIAKQACDIILLDDNFASIVTAIKWGRNVFDSISKFVQFQLTVNFVAIVVACVGAFAFNRSPLGPVQMLWVNLIMDSFAAFALATDPPSPELLDRAPYGKKRPIISLVMACNIIGQGFFQILVILLILWNPQWIPDGNWAVGNVPGYPPNKDNVLYDVENDVNHHSSEGSIHWTVIFNTFVMMQLANQFNARKLQTSHRLKTTLAEWNVFQDITKNPLFIFIFSFEFIGQVLIIQFADTAFSVKALSGPQWLFCIGLGLISFPWQFVVNIGFLFLDFVYRRYISAEGLEAKHRHLVADAHDLVVKVEGKA